MKNKKILGCLPWVGEWGWELTFWNPLCRYYAEKYDYAIAAAPHNSQYLYEFADEFIQLDTIGTSYCDGHLLGDSPIINADIYLSPQEEFAKYPNEPEKISSPRKWRHLSPSNPIHVADIMCAFRPQKIINNRIIPGKKYPLEKCQQLVNLIKSYGLSVACFGGLDNYCPLGAIDFRGKQLKDQCGALAAAKCTIGPSSGTIHLAVLCECANVITWIASIHHTLEKRYQKLWNPFKTPVKFICNGCIPSPEEIVSQMMEIIR